MPATTNDDALVPRTTLDGPVLQFDLPGFLVGAAEYDEGPTGCTVFVFPDGASVANDVRGGAVGFTGDYSYVAGICLAGGSLMGLEATAGMAAEIYAQRGYPTDWTRIPCVSGAIVYDYRAGRTSVYPDKALGRAAVRDARPGVFPLGTRGAGRSAGVGQGGAFAERGGVRVAVFTVVNALGAIVDRTGHVVFGGNRIAPDDRPRRIDDVLRRQVDAGLRDPVPAGNTTLTVVVTDARIFGRELQQFARQVHASMARAIQPFHTLDDGDVLWAVATGTGSRVQASRLGILASDVAWDAVLSSAGHGLTPAG